MSTGNRSTNDHRGQVAELLAGYRRSRELLAETGQQLSAITETAESDDGSIKVTVGSQGVLSDLVLSEEACARHKPSQLAATIVVLTERAARAAAERAAQVLAPVLPPGTDPAALLAGRADQHPDDVPPPQRVSAGSNPEPGTQRLETPRPSGRSRRIDEDDEDNSEIGWLQPNTAKRTER